MNELHEIESYGLLPIADDNLIPQLDNIAKNFIQIMSAEYLRGSDGADLYSKEIILENEEEYTEMVKSAIKDGVEDSSLIETQKGTKWDDKFKEDGYNKIYLIYKRRGDEEEIISSLPYTFIDKRFTDIDDSFDYSTIEDLSCTIMYQNGKFVKIQNFPTIYYDTDKKEFCWFVSGQKTGLVARGPEGKVGNNGTCLVAKLNKDISGASDGTTAEVTHVQVYNRQKNQLEYVSLYEAEKYGIALKNGDTVISTFTIDEGDGVPEAHLIISIIYYDVDSQKWLTDISNQNSITGVLNLEMLEKTLKMITPIDMSNPTESTNKISGLFIPAKSDSSNSVEYHTITSVSSENNQDQLWIGPSNTNRSPYTYEELKMEDIGDKADNTKMYIAYPIVEILGGMILKNISIDHDTNKFSVDENGVKISASNTNFVSDEFAAQCSSSVDIFVPGSGSIKIKNPDEYHAGGIDIKGYEAGVTIDNLHISGSLGYELLTKLEYMLHFETGSKIVQPHYPFGGYIGAKAYKTHVLLPGVYNSYEWKDGIPFLSEDQITEQLSWMCYDSNYSSKCISYIINNQSGETRKILIGLPIKNRGNATTIDIENNHRLNIQYMVNAETDWDGEPKIDFVLCHDYD